jgi:O-methyltransferase
MVRRLLQGVFRIFGIDAYFFRHHEFTDYVCMDRNMLEWYYHNEQERLLYDEALSRTGMEWSDNFPKLCRHYLLQTLAQRVLDMRVEGDFAECGCWKGTSSYELAKLISWSGLDKRLHIFDSFEGGLSDKAAEDANSRVELSKDEIETERMIFSSTEQEVRNNLSAYPFVEFYAVIFHRYANSYSPSSTDTEF